jgi:hypothetical protein
VPINLANDVILHYVGGLIVGSVVGGAFLFAAAAAIRNLFVK